MPHVERTPKGKGKGSPKKPANIGAFSSKLAVYKAPKLGFAVKKKIGASGKPAVDKVSKRVANVKPHHEHPKMPTAAERQREAQRRFRANMRRQGMKLVQIWVPDTGALGFAEEARRQSALIANAAADPTSDEAQMNRELAAWAQAINGAEPDYDWGPEGPPK